MSRFRSEVLDWFEVGRVAPDRENEVLRAAGMMPGAAEWRAFLSNLALWLGTIALAAAIIFFFAFNWDDLGRFAKFGLVEGAIVIGLLALWRLDLDQAPGKAVLLLLSLLTGALLALTGQIYQTGADSWELFAWWALLILPWVLVGRFSPLWLFWLALVDMAALLYFMLSWDVEPVLWALFAINGLALAAWETAHRRGISWLQDDWPPRLIAIASGVTATSLAVWAILGASASGEDVLAGLAWAAWLAALYYWYRHVRLDLFMLAGGLLSLIVVVMTFLSNNLLGPSGSGGLLLIGLVVIGMAAGGALLLKSVGREQAE